MKNPLRWLCKLLLMFTCLAAVFAPSDSFAAKVVKVNKKKKSVYISEGSSSGFTKGSKVCFYKKRKKITCGKVKKSRPNKAIVIVKKKISSIKKGLIAKTKGSSASSISKMSSRKKSSKKRKKKKKGKYSYSIRGYWAAYFVPMTQANYNKLSYDGPNASAKSPPSLWKSEGSATDPELTFDPNNMVGSGGAEIHLASSGIRLGAHYKQYRTFLITSDFDADAQNFMETIQSGTATGVYFDYELYSNSKLSLALGLDYEISTVTLQGSQKNDLDASVDNPYFDLQSTNSIISLRLPIRYDVLLLPLGLSVGMNFLIPVSNTGEALSASTLVDPEASSNVTNLEEDFSTALQHTNSSIAIETIIGLFIAL